MDVADWLNRLGLPQYIEAFRGNDVSPGLLKKLTADDLKEIGVGSVGHRRQILAAVDERCCLCRKSDPDVTMVQSAEDRQRQNAPYSLDRPR